MSYLTPQHDDNLNGPAVPESELRAQRRQGKRLLRKIFGFSERLGHYEFLDEIGHGGMGVVHLAHDHLLDRAVAIKRVKDPGDRKSRDRLMHEAKAMAQFAHPNIVPVFEIREQDDETFIVMEYVEGATLHSWLCQQPRTLCEILRVFIAAAEGLSAAHARGLIHRDFKPMNVIIGTDGRPRIMDFGLARTSADEEMTVHPSAGQAGREIAGTPAYMSPEQARGYADAQSDQFSFCVALYEAVYGRRPFAVEKIADIPSVVARGCRPPRGRSVPRTLEHLILRGLESQPNMRFESMRILLDILQEIDVGSYTPQPPILSDTPQPNLQSVQSRGANRPLRVCRAIAFAVLCSVGATHFLQPWVCPVVVPIEACIIGVEDAGDISRGWIVLEHGGEYEVRAGGMLLHFDCLEVLTEPNTAARDAGSVFLTRL